MSFVTCMLCSTQHAQNSRRMLGLKVSDGKLVMLCTRCVSKLYILRIIEKEQFSEADQEQAQQILDLKRIVEV